MCIGAYLLQSFLHLLKVSLFVEVGRHDFCHQGLQHIGKEEQQETAQQPCKGAKDILDV